jgi:signal transduction histidine kinase
MPFDRAAAKVGDRPFAWMADPGRFQLLFAAIFFTDLFLRWLLGSDVVWQTGPVVASILAGVVVVAALAVPWQRMDPRLTMLLPVLDIAVVGIARLSPQGGNGLLVVFPALWLGRQFGRAGAFVTAVASVVFIAIPWVIYSGSDPTLLTRTLFIPVVAVVTALVIADGMEQVRFHAVELEHQRRVSEAIFDTVDVGLMLLDKDGQYVGMNRRHREFLDMAFPDGHLGYAGQLGAVFDADGRTLLTADRMPSQLAAQGQEFDDLRLWIGADPDTRRALSVSARVVRAEDGSFAGASLAYTDVTDLMSALRVKDQFVALVSHELRTPLTSIVGYIQLLEDDEDMPPHAVRQLKVVHRNADRLHRLIADLLDTANRDGKPLQMNRTRVDLAAIVRESVEAARPAAEQAGVTIGLEAPSGVPMVADPQRFAQVSDNLISNALKYTEPGGRVDVRLDVALGYVELAVADTGIGISAEDRERLFTPFFRTADAARRAVAGAGLGLSITRDIVTGHGGTIEVESEPGRGSVFRVRLPA